MEQIELGPQPGPQLEFAQCDADLCLYGGEAGGGKSWSLCFEPLKFIDLPDFTGLILRETYTQIEQIGGLWNQMEELYPQFGGEANYNKMRWKFPSGAVIGCGYLAQEKHKLRYQGAEITYIAFDELTHFSWGQFWYLYSRNRSTTPVRPYMRMSCNPDAEHWVADFISWWIDPNSGYILPERSGVKRWFLQSGTVDISWGDTRDECVSNYLETGAIMRPGQEPNSFTFIHAGLGDNLILQQRDPGYESKLQSLPVVERERLAGGNWHIRDYEGAEWGGQWFDELWPAYWPKSFELATIGIDPSRGQDPDKGDYGAIVFTGLSGGMTWVDAVIERMPLEVLADAVVDMFLAYPSVEGIALEKNMNQDISFGREIERVARERGIPAIPLYLVENKERKELRIFRLNPHVTQKTLRFRPNVRGTRRLESQIRGFPLKDVHDDGPDALEMSLRLLLEFTRRNLRAGSASRLTI